MKENIVKAKSFDFAVNVVHLYKRLIEKNELILGKQLLRSGTSVGANIRESCNAESRRDFIHKLSVAQKECDESIYWLELLRKTEYIGEEQFSSLSNEANDILRILKSSIITAKRNLA